MYFYYILVEVDDPRGIAFVVKDIHETARN